MVFNIASAALVLADYQRNSSVQVTHPEYALAITEIVTVGLAFVCDAAHTTTELNVLLTFIKLVFNIIYSSYIITYYDNEEILPMDIINLSLATVIFNAIIFCTSCVNSYIVIRKQQRENEGRNAFFHDLSSRLIL